MQRMIWLSIATVTYVLAFWVPEFFWWCVFLYPIGIIVTGVQHGIPWHYSLVWGWITYTLHSFGLYYGLINMGEGPIYLRLIPSLAISVYVALFPTVCFTLATYAQRNMTSPLARTGIWLLSILTLTLLLDTSIFAIFGTWEGNPLFHPIIPLASVPQLISLLPLIGKTGYTICILLVSGTIAYAIISPRKHHLMWILCAWIPWLVSYYAHIKSDVPHEDISRVTVIPILFPPQMSIDAAIQTANNTMREAQSAYPDTTTYIFPESAFHCGSMDQYADQWATSSEGTRVVYGAFSWSDNQYYNTLAIAQNGKIVHQFRKRHTMLLTEHIPYFLQYQWLHQQYCSEEPEITPSSEPRTPMTLVDGSVYIPYICSELFMYHTPDDPHNHPILFIGNDVWLRHNMCTYMGDILLLHGRMQALSWQRPIMYTTYLNAYYITSSGELTPLQVFA